MHIKTQHLTQRKHNLIRQLDKENDVEEQQNIQKTIDYLDKKIKHEVDNYIKNKTFI